MYDSLWRAALPHLSAERMKAQVAECFGFSRWSSFDQINALARRIADRMEEIGLDDVRLIEFPADGRTAYGGWVIPEAYDVDSGCLTARINGDPEITLADYRSNPTSLMLYSRPTPASGVEAGLVVADTLDAMTADRVGGQFVLTCGKGVEYGEAATRAGAAGLVSDCRASHRHFKNGPYLDETNEWHNYTIPPWHDPAKGFGFSITPRQGLALRAALAEGRPVRVHARVQTRHYTGTLPVVSGLLRGGCREEIVITGHYDEFGADDNGSQVAVALEAIRAVRTMLAEGEMPPLARSLRILLPMEVRGFNALIQNRGETVWLRAGLNVDTVGTDQNAATSSCSLVESFMALPSCVDDLAADLLDRIAAGNPLFRWHVAGGETIDNIFGEPLVGAPSPAIYHFSSTHHLALDTPDRISGQMLTDMARLTATYTAFLAGAGLPEALWLAELSANRAGQRINRTAGQALHACTEDSGAALLQEVRAIHDAGCRRIDSAAWMVPEVEFIPTPETVSALKPPLLGEDRLLPQEFFAARAASLQERLRLIREDAESLIRQRAADFFQIHLPALPSGDLQCPSVHFPPSVPLKTFRGFLSFEDMGWEERQWIERELHVPIGWGAPVWLQEALMLANGKRTTAEIANRLIGAGNLPDLEPIFAYLAGKGRVRLRPYLTPDHVRAALTQAGIGPGDAILCHFSLSRFGYLEGGSDGLIDTILGIIGPAGTLLAPAFSFSWIGRAPYDARQSPSRVGAVTDRFWRRPGVIRSDHPTHSFAAIGPLAERLLEGHNPDVPPLGPQSPIARLAECDGKIVMFAPLRSNTSLHVGEVAAGIPYPDFLCPIMDDGVRREVLVPNCPWHVCFEAAYERLYARGQIVDISLGESQIHTMRCRDAIQAQVEVARESPEKLTPPGCECAYCRGVRGFGAV